MKINQTIKGTLNNPIYEYWFFFANSMDTKFYDFCIYEDHCEHA